MRIVLKKNNVVINIVECCGVQIAAEIFPDCEAVQSSEGQPGDLWDGERFISPQHDLVLLRQQIVAAIRAERDRRKLNGVHVAGKWIHTDTYSRTQWMSMKIMGASLPEIDWTTMDGSTISTTPEVVSAVFDAVALLDTTLFNFARNLITQAETSVNPASLDIKSGWPLTFGE